MRHETTRIYQRALELVSLSKQVIDDLPTGCGFLADQLRRASSSVALNFAEGCGKSSLADQRRFFRIARGSATEISAIFDVAIRLDAVSDERHALGKDLCDHLARMLILFR